jgi:hypothetical protein
MILITGCSSTNLLTNPSEVQDEVEGENVSMELSSGKFIKGRFVEIAADSIIFVKSEPLNKLFIPLSEIKEISVKDYGKGAWDGLLYGFITGALIGHTDNYRFNSPLLNDHAVISSEDLVQVEISSILDATHEHFLILLWEGKEILLNTEHIKLLYKTDDRIFITISKELYNRKFTK